MKNIGLVGLGFMGRTHLQAYKHIDTAHVAAICTRNAVTDEEVLSEYDVSFVTDYEALLCSEDIDIIDICLPTYLHEEYILKAAKARKHIICEKPLSLTVESAERIVREVNQHNVRLYVGHVLRFWPEYEMIKAYCMSEQLKGLEVVHAKRLGQAPRWSNWFQYPEKSGGALFDLHIHDIDFVTYLLGRVEKVYAVGKQNSFGAWDHVMTTLTFQNGCKAFVEASQRMPTGFPFTMSFRGQAAQATIEFEMLAGENIEQTEQSTNHLTFYKNTKKSSIQAPPGDAFQRELSYFIDCIDKNQENQIIPLDDVLYTLRILEAIQHSLEVGGEVPIT